MSDLVERVREALLNAALDQRNDAATLSWQAGRLWVAGQAAIDLDALARAGASLVLEEAATIAMNLGGYPDAHQIAEELEARAEEVRVPTPPQS